MTAAEMILLTILMCSASMAFSYQMENFEAGKCRFGTNDIVLWGISYVKCLQECRGRTACTSINVNQKAGECRLNFGDKNIQKESCGFYVYSEKSNWKQKTRCDGQNCGQESNVKTNSDCTCAVEECKELTRPDDCILMGNGRLIGHKVAYVYRNAQNMNTSVQYKQCMKNGTWSGEPIVDCAGHLIPTPPPTQSATEPGHTTESTAPTETSPPATTVTGDVTIMFSKLYNSSCTQDNGCGSLFNLTCRRRRCQCRRSLVLDSSQNVCVEDCPMPRYGSTYQEYRNRTIINPRNLCERNISRSYSKWKDFETVVKDEIHGCIANSSCRATGGVAEGGKVNVTYYYGKGQLNVKRPTVDFEYAVLFVRDCA